MEYILYWIVIGIVGAAIATYIDYTDGTDLKVKDLIIGPLMGAIIGPLMVFVIYNDLKHLADIVLIKGKGK